MDNLPFNQVEVEKINNVLMDGIKGKIKVSNCRRLEELGEGTEVVVKAIKEIEYRSKIRYILEIENLDALYLSNYWLEKDLENGNVDLNFKLKIKLDKVKVTPCKNKARVVFCV